MVSTGIAIDITHADDNKRIEIEKEEEVLVQKGFSSGVYGCNGKLFQGRKTGKLYAITSSSSAIYIF